MRQDNLADLTALIESIVAQTLSRSGRDDLTTWMTNNPRTSNYMSYDRQYEGPSSTDRLFQSIGQIGSLVETYGKNKNQHSSQNQNLNQKQGIPISAFGNALGGASAIYGAYKSGDALGGAASGAQAGAAFGPTGAIIGAALGLLAGLFSKGVDKWQRPKFKDADKAYDKLFSLDRGEKDEFFLPESSYFRPGGKSPNIVVRLGNNQFDEHIRESLTNSYASQLQRGLVF